MRNSLEICQNIWPTLRCWKNLLFVKENNIDIDLFFSVDGIENSSSVSYELDKPYTSMRNGIEETTVCSRLNENLLIYNSKVPANGWNIGK